MKTLPLALLIGLLVLAPTTALASDGIVNLSWDNCGTAGHSTEVFACDTNDGTHTLVGSYQMFVPFVLLNGNEMVIELQVASPTLAPWWQVKVPTDGTSACRNGSASMAFDYAASFHACHDYWQGRALGGMGIIRNTNQVNRQRILGVCAVALEQAGPLAANVETFSFRMVITNAKTIGLGSCGGCDTEATLVLTSITCTQNEEAGDHKAETIGAYAVWNPAPVPTRNVTWGAIKSMYR